MILEDLLYVLMVSDIRRVLILRFGPCDLLPSLYPVSFAQLNFGIGN